LMSRSAMGNPILPMPIQPIFCVLPVAIVKLLCVSTCPSTARECCNVAKDAMLAGTSAMTLCLRRDA
jgi:hypothetical protein